jgi:sugar/nucleoside kinase (ribokinase family)
MARVLVVGDVINDVLAAAPGPLVHGGDNPAVIRVRPGGSAANQAVWLAGRGVEVLFAGRAGAADAEYHRQELARTGVRPHVTADESVVTGSIVVLVEPDGERTMLTFRGANLNLCSADVPATLLDGADLLHLTGYTFFAPGPRAVALGLIAAARRRGIPFTVDPGSAAFLADLAPGAFLTWTAGAAVCFPNREEAAVLSRLHGSPEELAEALTPHYGVVAVKLGADGALVVAAGAEPVRVPAVPAVVRDSTGAGDAFCAGFLAAWLAGDRAPAAAAAGARTAARAVSALGGRP